MVVGFERAAVADVAADGGEGVEERLLDGGAVAGEVVGRAVAGRAVVARPAGRVDG